MARTARAATERCRCAIVSNVLREDGDPLTHTIALPADSAGSPSHTHNTEKLMRLKATLRGARLCAAAAAATALSGCAMMDEWFGGRDRPASAVAELMTPQGQPGGRVELVPTGDGVQVTAQVQGLSPGAHGFHIHTNGVCAPGPDGAAFGAAGGHFDPGNANNHGAPGRPASESHAGDMPNIPVGADGRGALRYLNRSVTLATGGNGVIGRSIVVHAGADDYVTDPAGNSGARVLCGVIRPRG